MQKVKADVTESKNVRMPLSGDTSYAIFLKVLKPEERDRLVENIGNHLINAQRFLQERAVQNFSQADPEFGRKLKAHLDAQGGVNKVNVVLVGI